MRTTPSAPAIALLSLALSTAAPPLAAQIRTDNAPATPARGTRTTINFNIPQQALSDALAEWSRQSGLQVLRRDTAEAAELTAPRVSGELTAIQALDRLLQKTGLKYEFVNDRTVRIAPVVAAATTLVKPEQGSNRFAQNDTGAASRTRGSRVTSAAVGVDPGSGSTDEKLRAVQVSIPEILVVGSRILNLDVKRTENDVQPYHIFDAATIQRSGALDLQDFLKQRLTMNVIFQTLNQMNSLFAPVLGGSTSSINLRGLGPNETLVLINGRRSAGVTIQGTTNQPDINGIPLSAIERIEVLPSSASAIYGGEAVGGVVNVILKKQFQGGSFNVIYENTDDGNAPVRTYDASYGFNLGDRTQVMLAGHYSDGDPLVQKDRPRIVERGIRNLLDRAPSLLLNPFLPFAGATPNISAGFGSLTLDDGTSLNSPITSIPAGTTPGANLSAGLLANAGRYNVDFAPGVGQYGQRSELGVVPRYKYATATVRHELSDSFEVFSELSTSYNESRRDGDPFFNVLTVSVPSTTSTNPFQQNVLVRVPTAASTPFVTHSKTNSATVGVLARLPKNWGAELDYTRSENSFSYDFIQADSNAFADDVRTGAVNPFVDTIAVPLDWSRYYVPVSFSGDSVLDDVNLRASGPLWSLPWGSPTLTVGLEHRKAGGNDADLFNTFPLAPDNNLHRRFLGRRQTTDSVYLEAAVPLVTSENAIPLVRSIDLQLAGRSERYTVHSGPSSRTITPVAQQAFDPAQDLRNTVKYTSTNQTIGLKYRPFETLALRASYATAFLPPTAAQLLLNPTATAPVNFVIDPLLDNRIYGGVSLFTGGNPDLEPQTSRDWDFGFIWEPEQRLLKGLRLNLQYFEITQPNYIVTAPALQIVADPSLSSRVTRDPADPLIPNRITFVDTRILNANKYVTAGWDFSVDYEKPTPVGTFGFYAAGTVTEKDQRQLSLNGPALEFVNFAAEGGATRTKANASLTWEHRQWVLGWTTTYYSSYRQFQTPGSPLSILLGGPNPAYTAAQGGVPAIPSQVYHDFVASYAFDPTSAEGSSGWGAQLLSGTKVQLGVRNIFNTVPPFDASFLPYYYSPFGDARLRSYRISIQKSF